MKTYLARAPERLTEEEKATVRRLASDIPALWWAPTTTARDRQAIARLMLERVVILVHGESERADLACHWAGGVVTKHTLIRPVRRFEQLEHFDQMLAQITEMRSQGATACLVQLRRHGRKLQSGGGLRGLAV